MILLTGFSRVLTKLCTQLKRLSDNRAMGDNDTTSQIAEAEQILLQTISREIIILNYANKLSRQTLHPRFSWRWRRKQEHFFCKF